MSVRGQVPLAIWGYVAALALQHAYVALPGDSVEHGGGVSYWLVLSAVLVLYLLRGSPTAWVIALGLDVLGVLALLLVAVYEASLAVMFVLAVVRLALLLARSSRDCIGARGGHSLQAGA
ncbi:MAG: hypothetical protein H0U03_09725 [Actinobacteria bacterium]|nr:hypothetical protein [Actinomycetota bacterium]